MAATQQCHEHLMAEPRIARDRMSGQFDPLPHPMDSRTILRAVVDWDGTLVRVETSTRAATVTMAVSNSLGRQYMFIEDIFYRTPVTSK
jgi:hypothetical protein